MEVFNSGYILSNKRHGWIDYDRGISIILVTYRHCFEALYRSGLNLDAYPFFQYINVFFSGFRMPLFFIASGIFVSNSIRKRGLPPYINNRLRTIFYPMLVWGCIQISLQLAFSDYTNSALTPRNYIDLLIEPRAIGQFWYLNALFFVGILYSSLKVLAKFKLWHQLVLGAILYLALAYIRTRDINLGFLMDVMQYYLFFAVGDAVSTFVLSDRSAKIFASFKLLIPLVIAFIVVQYFFTKLNLQYGDYYIEHDKPFYFLLVALIGCTLSICISFALKRFDLFPFIRVIGYNSVHIYCMQIIAIAIVRILMVKIFGFTSPLILVPVVLAGAIFIPMIVYYYALRLNLWWMFTLKKPEDEIEYMKTKKITR